MPPVYPPSTYQTSLINQTMRRAGNTSALDLFELEIDECSQARGLYTCKKSAAALSLHVVRMLGIGVGAGGLYYGAQPFSGVASRC